MLDHVFQAIIEGQKNENIPSKQTNKNVLEQRVELQHKSKS